MKFEKCTHKVIELQESGLLLVEDGNHGEYRPRRKEFTEKGVRFIRAADMEAGRVLFDSAQSINEVAVERIRKGVGQPNDTILSHKGTVGKVAYVPSGAPPFVCSPQTTFWRSLDHAAIDPRYLYYFLCSRFFHDQLNSRKNETDMAGYVSLTNQRDLQVIVPSPSVQQDIVSHIALLDDKIDLKRRMNETLEDMAQALFQAWFVDFEPVKAKQAASRLGRNPVLAGMAAMSGKLRVPRQAGALTGEALDAAGAALDELSDAKRTRLAQTAALFPDRLVESERGIIPEGWAWTPLDKVASFLNGTACQKYPATPGEESLNVIKIRELRSGFTDNTDKVNLSIPNKYIIENGDVLFSWSGSLLVTIWTGGRGALNQHVFKVSSSKYPKWFYFLWTKHHLNKFQRIAASKATTMGHIKRSHLSEALAATPSEGTIAELSKTLNPLLALYTSNESQASTLSELRDTLLPELLSGEVQVEGDFGNNDVK